MTSILTRLPRTLFLKGIPNVGIPRASIYLTSINHLKDIVHTEKDGVLEVKGVYVKSPREDFLIKPQSSGGQDCSQDKSKEACPLCRLGPLADQIKHTDVLILTQFIRPDGTIMPKRVTGLCFQKQKIINWLVAMSKQAGLIPNHKPNYPYKKFNKYYDDEIVIKNFLMKRKMRA